MGTLNKTFQFSKFCIRCNKKFKPDGKFQKICLNCSNKNHILANRKRFKMQNKKIEFKPRIYWNIFQVGHYNKFVVKNNDLFELIKSFEDKGRQIVGLEITNSQLKFIYRNLTSKEW
jgi:hypothetical protein